MKQTRILEQIRIPADIENVKELDERVVVDPEDSVIDVTGHFRVVVKRCLQLLRPVLYVVLGEVSLPSQVRPGVFELEETGCLEHADVEDRVGVGGDKTGALFLVFGERTSGQSEQAVAGVDALE